MDPIFPDEDIILSTGTTEIRSSIKKEIYKNWGKISARDLFSRRDKVTPGTFDLINWDIMPKVMKEFSKTFQGWI